LEFPNSVKEWNADIVGYMQAGDIIHVINRKLEKACRKDADIALKCKETVERNRYGARVN
jgi:hypothetical protein